ncbi:nucleoside-diphosphate-sugar epimerase [Streptomyces umbrinus]|uniref:Nucleoside-diphosphate-sugar epimerase n=1 Tax=Streptomyces umbrinus TaxID=67370 RepID=A0ABU0SMD6_9ACTN|nr:hypothetical protein [Streptomyces umbrinus]MDQ1023664.1 nucleoside-diphosphate-sugar epimerase [Streptomyces umbrinus]
MTSPRAAGERFIGAAGDTLSMHDIARVLRERLGDAAHRVPVDVLPDEAVLRAAETAPAMRQTADQLGIIRRLDNARARRLLDWNPRSGDDAVTATAESLLRLGLLKDASLT